MNDVIRTTEKLNQTDLLDLINGKILALRIYPFINISTCQKWQNDLNKFGNLSRYSNALDVPVNRIGMTLFETENKPEKIAEYLDSSILSQRTIQKIFGQQNPMDEIIYSLKNCWNAGCETQKLSNKEMNPGIIRSFEASANGGLPPHIDSLLKDLPDTNEFKDLKSQLAANLYFNVCKSGGELELWNYAPNENELEELFTGSYDFIDTKKLPVTPKSISPKQGELIIFRSSCVHSVKSSQGGTRSAASCFIGYYDDNQPLKVWA